MSTLSSHVLPLIFCVAVIAVGVVIAAAQVASTIHASRRRAAGRAPARHSRRATPADHVRTIRRALRARRVDEFEALLQRRADERLAEIAGGAR